MSPSPTDSSSGGALGTGYRPHLDGVRAVAVYLVVVFHAGVDWFSGGFIGVDVFFVMSGYLVTQVLSRSLRLRPRASGGRSSTVEHGSPRSFGLSRFYARRYRRLLPASFVAVVVTAIVYSAVASRAELAAAVGSFKATLLYVANWYFIHQSSDYFAATVNANPVQQFWSLAVEEQFYFVWPILLTTLFVLTRGLRRHAHRVRQIVIGAGVLLSLMWALHLASSNISRAYFGTDARAYQLLAGALLALSPGVLRRASHFRVTWWAAPLALAALVVLSTSLVGVNPVERGIGAAAATALLIVGLESLACGPLNRLFSARSVVYLGRISYGTYLWHWPVILFAGTLTDHTISPLSTFAVAVPIATGLAALSYELLEMPIRRQSFLDRINPAVIGAGAAISVIGALVIIPNVIDPYQASGRSAQSTSTAGGTPVPSLDFANVTKDLGDLHGVVMNENCIGGPVSACTQVHGRGMHILLIGDSHARMMEPTFAKIAQQQHLTFSAASSSACPWQRNLYSPPEAAALGQSFTRQCITFKRDLYQRVIPALKPDLIITWSNDYLTRRHGVVYDARGNPTPSRGPGDLQQQVRAETERSLAELERVATKVLIAEPVPTAPAGMDPFQCLTKSKVLEACRFVADPNPRPIDFVYRQVADNRRVYEASFAAFICPYLPICDPVLNGMIVRFDNQHITPKYAVSLAAPMTLFLESNQLLPRRP